MASLSRNITVAHDRPGVRAEQQLSSCTQNSCMGDALVELEQSKRMPVKRLPPLVETVYCLLLFAGLG